MRILHVTKKYPNALGGDAIVVQNLEKQQTKNGNEVFILTTNCDDIIDKKNLTKFGLKDTSANLDRITLRRVFSLIGLYFKSFKILREIKPDVVHSHSVDMGYILHFACKKYNIPLINHFHAGFFLNKKDNLLRFLIMKRLLKLSKFNGIITINDNDFNKNKGKFDKLFFIPNAINLNEFNSKKDVIRDDKSVLFIGRVEKYKGLHYLINSIKLVRATIPSIKLIIIGDGSYLKKCKKLSEKLKLQDNVIFRGKLDHALLNLEYKKSSIFVLPSYTSSETFGIVLLESLACKTPVITTDIVGIASDIKKNNCGIVIKTKDSQALSDAIIKILNNPKLARKMGENGRKLVEKKYTWEKISKNVEKLYAGVVIK